MGTLAALGDRGPAVASALADDLKLGLPDLPWHTHRDRFAEVATTLGLLVGTLGKIARDISLMAQTEVAEVAEPSAPGKGGSSTMPHKQNPVGCAVILAAAIRVPALVSTMLTSMVQEHERGLGGWHAEWETLPEICTLAGGAVAQAATVLGGLQIHENRMAENIDETRGLIFSEAVAMVLRKKLGRSQSHQVAGRREPPRRRTESIAARCAPQRRESSRAAFRRRNRPSDGPQELHRFSKRDGQESPIQPGSKTLMPQLGEL